MILVLRHGVSPRFYNNKLEFALSVFNLQIVETKSDYRLSLNNHEYPISYSKEFSKNELLYDFSKTDFFTAFYQSRYFRVYHIIAEE